MSSAAESWRGRRSIRGGIRMGLRTALRVGQLGGVGSESRGGVPQNLAARKKVCRNRAVGAPVVVSGATFAGGRQMEPSNGKSGNGAQGVSEAAFPWTRSGVDRYERRPRKDDGS
jgi:hypothetical protein